MSWTFVRRALLAAAITAVAAGAPAQAQDYPTRQVTIVVPLAAGSGMDSLVRLYAEKLQVALGKPVVVDNRPGAALMLAAAAVATAPADGYTVLIMSTSHAISKPLYKTLKYDVEKDLVPVAFVSSGAMARTASKAAGAWRANAARIAFGVKQNIPEFHR